MSDSADDKTPEYVHKLLDAFLKGSTLNFGRAPVPADIRQRLDEAAASGALQPVRDLDVTR